MTITNQELRDYWKKVADAVSDNMMQTSLPPDAARATKQDTMIASLGNPTDVEATGNGSIIGVLKRLRTLIGDTIVTIGSAIGSKAQLIAGSDGTNARALKTAADGTLLTQLTGRNVELGAVWFAMTANVESTIFISTDVSNFSAIQLQAMGGGTITAYAEFESENKVSGGSIPFRKRIPITFGGAPSKSLSGTSTAETSDFIPVLGSKVSIKITNGSNNNVGLLLVGVRDDIQKAVGTHSEKVYFWNGLAISDTLNKVSPTIDLTKYKKFTIVAINSLDQEVEIFLQEVTGAYYGYWSDSTSAWVGTNSNSIKIPPSGQRRNVISTIPLPLFDVPLERLTVIARCAVAPTNGSFTLYLLGVPN